MSQHAAHQADAHYNRDLRDWKFKADRLKPRGCTVTQLGAKGFWFTRPGQVAGEFMAWPASEPTAGKYGRVDLRNIKTCSDLDGDGIL